MNVWHGGKLEDSYQDSISHKKGRWEHGPGLYLTTHYDTAKKYLDIVLNGGGAKSMSKLFNELMDRDPNPSNLLRLNGIN